MGAGIDSGPVTVGLTGGWGVVYDAWGSTVQRAADLARRSGANRVAVSHAVQSQLPSSFVTEDEADSSESPGATTVSGRMSDMEPLR
jgi:class 3 adenylate cyclase